MCSRRRSDGAHDLRKAGVSSCDTLGLQQNLHGRCRWANGGLPEGAPTYRGPIPHLPGREAEEDCMQSLWRSFWSDESGQGLVEYALIIALVAVGLIAILLVLRNSIGNVFNNAATQLNNAPANPYP